jgi:hypothetical protein
MCPRGRQTSPLPLAATVVALLLVPSAVNAAGGYDSDYEEIILNQHHAVGFHLGLGSAVGFLGVTYSYSPITELQFEFGSGYGASGFQESIMPKLVLGNVRDRFVTGLGIAIAVPAWTMLADGLPIWLNIDALGYEHRFDHGSSFTFGGGLAVGLGGGHVCSLSLDCEFLESVAGKAFPQARIGFNSWF